MAEHEEPWLPLRMYRTGLTPRELRERERDRRLHEHVRRRAEHGARRRDQGLTRDEIVAAARLAQVPIVPLAYAARRRRVMRSWDRFLLPWPLNRGLYLWGEPIRVPADADGAAIEHYRALVEARLNALGRDADRRMGHAAPSVPSSSLPLWEQEGRRK
jgi:hypothetical protein